MSKPVHTNMDEMPERNDYMILGLEPIIDYQMTPQEAKAWKVCCLWCKFSREIFPDHAHATVPKKGDPRKCSLFRYAWKMLRETEGYGLPEKDISLYVRAQLEMIKAIKVDASGTHARLDPVVLTGEKAWIRWKMYKRKHDRINEDHRHQATEGVTPSYRIGQELDATLKFLLSEYGELPSLDQIRSAAHDGRLRAWVTQRRISPYYCLMSPLVREVFSGLKMQGYFTGIDLEVYKKDIDRESLGEMTRRFPGEFKSA